MSPTHRARRPSRRTRSLRLWRAGWAAVAALGVAAGLWWTWRQPQAASLVPPKPRTEAARATPRAALPTARALPGPGGGLRSVPPAAPPPRPTPAARVAIIFDDAGATVQQVEPILTLGRPVTLAVLPGLAASEEVARLARAAGLEVLLHLPLEAEEEHRLGPGGVTTAMSDQEIAAVVRAGLAEVPGAVGINGHMGSRATADPRVMTAVLEVVREQGLFFVDSRTTPRTVALPVARALGVPAVERTVFLDNDDDPAYIAGQVRRLLEVARTRGFAIGIGHAQRGTAEVLHRLLPEFDRAGVVLVPVSALLNNR